ncbi:MAG TPA: ROK family protein [Spirochaetia bacterium]|nr:ROK family protein [Spirochaetia bacterium]
MKPLKISATANSNLQNTINISIIFNHIRETGAMYRAQLVKDLGLSAPAVSRAVEYLKQEGFLIETTNRRAGSGKLTSWYEVNPQKGYVIGVDLITDPVKLAVFDYSCRLTQELRSFRFSGKLDLEGEIIAAIKAIIENHGSAEDIRAISFGLPAVVSQGGVVESAVLYEGLEGKNLKDMLEPVFGVPVFADNTANLSALAESRFGKGRDAQSFIFVEVSNGVGAGVVHEGSLIRGRQGAAGEIGYGLINADGKTLEQRASLLGIAREGRDAAARRPQSLLAANAHGDPEAVTAEMVFESALAGCEVSKRIVEEAVALLSTAVQHAVLLLDPELIVLGGDMCDLPGVTELVIDPLRQSVNKSLPYAKPRIELSEIGDNAGVLGAATLALESLLLGRYPYKLQN